MQQEFFIHDNYSDTIRLMPYNLLILFRNGTRWMLDIDLLVDGTLATRIFQLMHDYDTLYQPYGSVLAAQLDACIVSDDQSQQTLSLSNKQFECISPEVMAKWPEKPVPFFGDKGQYIMRDLAAYFIWDGTHVATLTRFWAKWNPNTKIPGGYRSTTRRLFPGMLNAIS